jgi:O-antigen/teichoic acid export membrane protein
MIVQAGLTLGRALAVRAAPGVINLIALTLIARTTAVETYGILSLIITTAVLVSNLLFGLVILPIVSQYATHHARGDEGAYASTSLALAAVLSLPVLLIAGSAAGHIRLAGPTLCLALILSLHSLLQELMRARQSIYLYGASDLAQSVGFLSAILILATPQSRPADIAMMFAASHAPAIAVSLFALRKLRPTPPRIEMAREILGVGRWLVLTNLTEQVLFTGARYLVLGAAGPQALGVFSFAVDVAQRTVAFVINAASFIYLPKAFSARVRQGHAAFVRTLREGAIVSSAAAIAAMAFVCVASRLDPAAQLVPQTFDLTIFCLVAAAAVVNRIKKLIVDSLGLATGRSHRLAIGNLAGAVTGLGAMALLAGPDATSMMSAGYLAGYVAIFGLSLALVTARRRPVADLDV